MGRVRRGGSGLTPAALLRAAKGGRDAAQRAALVSEALVGSSYRTDPLGGAPGTPERFTAALDGFDCVTFVETVLAAALARRADEFAPILRKLRYQRGSVSWETRNHYMTGWLKSARREGMMRGLSFGAAQVEKSRRLDVVPGVPSRTTRLRCLPKRLVRRYAEKLRSGDLVCFVSTRARLDVFHCALLFRVGGELRLRHASRSRGEVVDQDFFEFLHENRMAGVLVARPVERDEPEERREAE